jgi:Tol biopolymer transport system component
MKKILQIFIIFLLLVSCSREWNEDLLVAFVSNDGSHEHLYICTENGENVKRLTDFSPGRFIDSISFSPDGDKIAMISYDFVDFYINIIDKEGKELYEKVLTVENISGITWLLDGKLLFFCSGAGTEFPETGGVIFDYTTDSIIPNSLGTLGYAPVNSRCYSAIGPDRCVIVDNSTNLRIVSISTGESFYSQPGFQNLPITVSPDGDTVLFFITSDITSYKMGTHVSSPFVIPGYASFKSISFSPDGSKVAFTDDNITSSFYIYNIKSMTVKTITPGVGSFYPLVSYQYKPI